MGNKVRTLFHKISKNYPLLHWSQFLPFLQSKWWKNGLFLHFLEIVYFFVISTQGIMGNKLRTLFHKISKNYPLLHWSQFLPFLQSKWWKNGLFLHFLEIVYFFVISTQGIMGNKVRTLFHKISKNYPLLHEGQFLTFLPSKWSKNGPFLDFLEIVYFFVISTQGIMGNKLRTLFHKISKNYPLLHWSQFLPFLQSKWWKNGLFLHFLEIVYFFVISTQGIMGNKLRTLFHKISKNYPLLHWSQFLPFLQSKWWKNGLFLHFLEIVYFFVISTQGIMGNKVRTLFHKISKNYPLLHEGQFLTFLPSKWSKNGPFLDFLEIVYFFVISTQGIMGNNFRTLFHKISKNYPLLHWSQFLPFLQSKWWQNGLFLHFLEIVYFFVISTQGIMGNKVRTLFHKISKNYPLLHEGQFLTFLPSKWSKNGPFLDFLEIVYFFVISTQGIMGNKLRTLFHKISKNYPLLHWSQFLPFLQSKWWKNGLFLHFLEIVYFFVISTQGIMGNKVRTLFHKISKNYPLLHEGQFLTFLPSKWSKNGPFLDFLEIVYFFVISTQGIMGNKLRTLFHKISKNYPLLHWSQFLPFLQSKWWKNGLFLHFLEIVYFFVISTQGIMGNKLRTLFHKISKNYPLLHEGQFLTFLPSKWSKNGPFLDFLEIVYFFVISTQGIMGNKLRTLFHKISKNYPLLHWSQFLPFLQSKWWKNGLFLHFLEIVYFFVISTQGIMGNKVRTLFHKISKNYPLLHEGQFLTFLPSKWSKNGPFLDFLEIVYFFVISTQGIMGNKLRTLFHKISKNYPLLHWSQFLPFLQSKWWKNGLFLHFLEIVYFFVISTQGIMGNKVRTLFHKISKNYPLLHEGQFLTFLPSKWSKNGPFLDFLEIVYFFVISTQGIMGNKLRTLFHKISKNYPLLHWSQFLPFLQSKWWKNGLFLHFLEIVYFFVISTQGIMGNKVRTLFHKISKNYPLLHEGQFLTFLPSKWSKNGPFLDFLEIVYFFVISTQGIMGNKLRTLFHKISKNYPLLHWSQFLPFLQSKWWKNGLFLHFLEIVYFFVISTQGIMGNKVRTLFHKISKNYPLLHEGQFLTFLPSKWSKNGPFLDFLEIVYFFVISTQGIMGNKLRTLFHKISKNYPLLHWSQFLPFLQSKWWKNGLFLHFLEIVYLFVISTQGIMGNKVRTLFHKISKNYPLLHEGQFLTFLPSKWSKNGPFLDFLEIVYFFVISTQGIMGNKLRTLFHKISKNYPLLHWSQFLPFLQSKWWKNGLFLDFLEIVYFFVISTQGIMGNKVRTLFHKISKNYPLLHEGQFLTFLPSKWSKNGPFLDFLEIVYFFVISTQGIMGNKLRTLFHKISKNYPLLHEGQFLTFLPSKWSKNGPFLDFLEIVYFFVISTQGIMGNKLRTLFHKISKNYPLLHWSQFLPFLQSKWWKNGLFLHFLEIVYFFVISTQGIMGNKLRTLFHKISKNYPLLHWSQFLPFLQSKWWKNGLFLHFLEIVYFFVISTQGIMGNKVRTLFHKISKNYPLLHEGQFLTFLPSKWSKNGPFLDFLEIVYFFVISTQGIMGNKLRTLFHKISKNYPLLHWSQFLPFLQSKWWQNGLFLHFLEIVYFFVISTQGIMGNKVRTLFHKISKNYPLLHEGQFLTFLPSKWSKNGPFLDFLEIVYFFVISTQGIMGNKLRTLFHKISKNYPLLHWSQFLPFLQSKWWKNGLFLHFLEIVYFFVISTQGIMGNKVRTLFHKISKNYPLLHEGQFLTFLPSKWSKNGPFLDFLEIVYFFVISTQGIMGNKLRTLFHKISKNYPLLHWSQFLPFLQSKWWKNGLFLHFLEIVYFFVISTQGIMGNKLRTLFHKISKNYPLLHEGQFLTFLPSKWSKNGPFLDFLEIVYFFVISTQGIMGNKLRTLFHKISKNYPLLHWSQFLPFLQSKWWKNGLFLHFLEIVYFFVISTQGIMGNKVRTLFHKISKNYPLLHEGQFLTFLPSKWSKNGPFLDFLEIVYFFVISTQGIMGNKLRTLFHKISKNYPLLHWSQFLPFLQSKWWKNGLFLHFLEIVYFFVISTQGIMGNKVRTLFHKISKNYPLLHEGQFLTFLPSKWSKNGPFLDFLEIVYFFVISTQGIMGNKLRTLFHKISKNYPLLHWSQFLPFLQSKWWKNGLFLHFLEIVYFFVISTQGIMGNKVRTLFHKISKNYPLLHEGQFLTFLPSKWSKNGPFLDFLEIVYFFVISTQGIMGNKLRTLFHKISKNYPLLHWSQFLPFLQSKWWKNGLFLHFLEIVYFFVISTQGIMGNKVRTLFHKISKNYPLLHEGQFLTFLPSKWSKNGPFLDFLEIVYFFVISTQGIMGNKLRTLFHKISKNYPLLHWSQFLPFLQSKWWKNGLFLHFLEIVYFFVISTQGIMGNKVRTLFHKISKNYPLLHEGQFLTFLPSKWSKNGPFLDFLEIVYFFVISTQGIMGNKLRTLFHKISKNYPLLHWSQFLPFLQSKWWKNGLFLHFLEIVYFFVISTQGIMGNKVRTLFHKISKNYPLLHEGQFLTFLPSKWSKNGPFLDFLEIVYFFVISTQGIMGNKLRTLFHKISKNYPLLHWSQFLPFLQSKWWKNGLFLHFLQSKWWKNGLFLHFLEIVYFFVISTQGIMGNKLRTLFHKISKNYPLLHWSQFLPFLQSKWWKNGLFLHFLEIVYLFVISTQGIMGNKVRTLFHKISKNYPLLHEGQFLTFLPSKWSKNGPFLDFLEIVYFFVISTQGIMGNKLRTLFHKISKNYPLLHWSQFLPFLQSKWWKNGLFLDFLEIVYFFVISTQGIMGNKVRTLFHKISKNYPLLHEGQFLTFLPSKWSKNGPFLDFLEIVYFFVISTQGIMGNKLRTLFHKISKNYPLLHWSQFLPFLQSKWWKNGLFLHFLEIVYFFVISTQGIMGNKLRTLFHKISKNYPLLHWSQFLPFLQSKWWKNGLFLHFLEIVYFFVISTQGIMGNKVRTLFHKISKNYPLLHEGQFLTFLPSKWSKNGPFLDFLEIVYFFVISTQGIMGNKLRTLFHKISKNYPLLHWSQFLPFLQSKWWQNGLFLHFLEIVYFFVISTQGIMGNKVRTLFHKISKNYPLLHEGQFLTFLPSKWSKNGPFLDFLEIVYFFVISTQGIMGNKLRTLFHKISKNYPLLHWSQFLPFLQSKWWKNGLFLHFLEIVYFFVISTQGIMGNKVRTLFHKISKNYPLLHEGQFLTFLPSKWSKNGPFLDFLEIVYFFVISTQGIMGNKLRTLFHKISKNYPLLHWSQFLPFLQSKWWKNGLFLHFLEIVYFFVISTQGIMGNKLRTLFHKISKNYPLLHEGQFLTFLPSKWSKNGPFLDFLEIVYFFVISTQGIMGNKLRTLFHKISKNYPLLHWSQFLPFLQSKWWKNGLFLHFLEIVYFFVISTQGIMGNKVRTLFHKISKNYPLLHEGQFLTFLPSKWSKNGPFLDFLEIVYFFVISTQGIMGNKLRTLFHKISKNYPLLHWSQFLPFLQSKWWKNGLFLHFLEIVYFFVISTQGIMGNKVRTLFHKISKNYPLLHEGQFLTFLPSKWSKNGPFLDFLEIVYFFVISTQGIMGNKLRTLFHKISKNYPLLHWSQFLPFLQSKWWKNGLFLHFLEIVYFFVISTQGIMGNKVRTLFHKISKNYPLLHEGQFLTFLPSKWSKNGPFLDFLEIVYFFVISTQGIMGNKLRTLFHKISKNYPLLHWSQFLPFLQSKWWQNGLFLHFLEIVYFFVISTQGIMGNKVRTLFHKISKNYPLLHEGQFLTFLPSKWSKNGPFLDFLEIVYFFVISTQGIMGNKLRTLFHKISKNYPLLHWSQFLPFLQSKWWKNGLFLHFLEIVYFFVISTQGIMGNKVRTLFHKISKNYPLLHEGQFLTFLPSKWSKNGPFLDFLEIVYFFVISTQGIMGNKLRTLFHKISKNYPLLHWSQFLPFLQSKWWKNGLFLHFLEIVYFFVISTQGIMGNKLRTLFHKISKNYPLLHEGQFLTFLPSKWSKNGPFLDFLEIVYFFVISTQGIMGNKLRTLFHKISKNYPLLHWSQFLPFLQSKWWKNGLFLHFLEIVYFFVISTQGIMGNKVRTLFHKISKNYPLLHEGQFLTFLPSKWSKNGPFLDFLEIVYFFVISTQGIMGNKLRTLFHKISKNYPLLHWSQFLPFLQSKWWKNGLFLHFLEIVYFFVISTQGIMGNKVRTLFHKISKNYPLLHEGQFLTFLPSKWSKNGPFLDFLEIVYFFVISTQGIMGNKLRTLFHKISKNYPLLHWSQFLPFLQSKWWKNGLFLHFLEIVYFFVISTQGIMGNKVRTLFHKISKNYPLLHEGQFLTFLPSKWSKNGPFLDFLEIVYFFVISTQGIMGNKLRTLFHKISKNYPLLHWSQFLPFLQSKWWKNGLFLHFLEIVYFFVISTQGIMGNKVRTLFHKISKNYPLLHEGQFLTFLPSKWSKNGPFLDFLEIVYFFVISTQGIMGNKVRTLFHKISKNYPLLHEGQFLTFLPSKWSKNGPFLDFLEIVYFFVISTQGIMGNKLRTLFHKISKNYPLLHWSQFLPFLQSKWWKNGLFLHFLEIVYFFVISTQGIMGNKVRTLFHKISKNYPLLHEGQFLTFLPSKWSKNGPFLDFLEIVYFFVISTQGIMGNKLRTLFHKISKNYPLLHWSQFLPFLQSKWWKNGLFLDFLEIVYFFVISTQGIMGNKVRTLFHKISKNYPLLHEGQFLTFLPSKWSKNGPFLDFLEIVYFFVISTQGIMGNKLRTLFHKISKNYPLLHWSQFLPFLQSKWWKNGLFLHFLEIVYFFVISTQGIMGNKLRTLFHKISKNYPLLHWSQFLPFLQSKWWKNGLFLHFLEIVYLFVISTQGIMGNKVRTLFHKISKNYPLLHEGQFLTFLPSKWSKNGPFLDFLEIVYFFVISTQGIMGNKLRTLFHKISKNYPLLHWSQFLPFLQSKWWQNGLFLHFLEIVYFFVISTQGIMGNKVRTLFHKISKNYPLLHEGQFLTFLPSKWSKNGRFLDFLEIVYFFVISTQGIMGNKLRTLFHKISKNYPLLHWSQFLPFLQSKWWQNGLFLHFLEIVYFFVISTQGIMGNKVRTLFHKISKNYPLLHEGQFLTFLPSKWSKNGPFLDFLEIVYFFVISTQGIMGNKLRTLFTK